MTLKMIRHSRPEIAKLVMETYPKSKKEKKGCETEKAKMEHKRWVLAKRLIEEGQREKVEYKS